MRAAPIDNFASGNARKSVRAGSCDTLRPVSAIKRSPIRAATARLVTGVVTTASAGLLAATLFLPTAALAQDEGEAGVIYQKKTIVNFDEDTIDGDLTRPDAAYVESRKRVRHSNLIKIREDFREKILRSVSSL